MRRPLLILATAATVLCLAAPRAAAATDTLDQVIAKHIAARGGADKWSAIRTMVVTGSQTSFSKTAPFTLIRERDAKFHLDSQMGGKKVEIGFDGTSGWWDNHWFQEGAAPIKGADVPVVLRDADFVNPFFDYRARGHEVKLIGKSEFEGVESIAIEVKRADGMSETWHLDPKTYLEFARESPGSDFGSPMPLRTYYDDFRTVDGVKMPFRIESQWYTRERIWNVDKIETNVPVDEKIFLMPPPMGMGPLLPLVGEWKVAVQQRQDPSAPWTDGARESTIEKLLGGAVLQERFATTDGNQVLRSYTYDRFRKRYRVTEVNDNTTFLDISDGELDPSGKLQVSDVASGTTYEGFGMVFNNRLSLFEITPDGFKTEEEVSMDGGKNWFVAGKATYTKK
jgi:hypothetical protein